MTKLTDKEKVLKRLREAHDRIDERHTKIQSVAPALATLITKVVATTDEDWRDVFEISNDTTGVALVNAVNRKLIQIGYEDWEFVATRLRSNIALLFKTIGAERGQCAAKGCQAPVWWVVTKAGKRAPFTDDGLNHFANCVEADRFRRKS